jgi:hypothetical protein
MSRLTPIAFATVISLVSGCATTIRVGSHVEAGLSLSPYRNFAWGAADGLPQGDPRLDENPMFKRTVEAAVERELAHRGIERSDSGTADLLIHYHTNLTKRIEVSRVPCAYGDSSRGDCPAVNTEYEAGTLVLDIIDARRNTLVWRGWAQNWGLDILQDPEFMGLRLDEALTRMLARLPGQL